MQEPRVAVIKAIHEMIENKCRGALGGFQPYRVVGLFILADQKMDAVEMKSRMRLYLVRPKTMTPLSLC